MLWTLRIWIRRFPALFLSLALSGCCLTTQPPKPFSATRAYAKANNWFSVTRAVGVYSRTGNYFDDWEPYSTTSEYGFFLSRSILDGRRHFAGRFASADGKLDARIFPYTFSDEFVLASMGLLAALGTIGISCVISLVSVAAGSEDDVVELLAFGPFIAIACIVVDIGVYLIDIPVAVAVALYDTFTPAVIPIFDTLLLAGTELVDVTKTTGVVAFDLLALPVILVWNLACSNPAERAPESPSTPDDFPASSLSGL